MKKQKRRHDGHRTWCSSIICYCYRFWRKIRLLVVENGKQYVLISKDVVVLSSLVLGSKTWVGNIIEVIIELLSNGRRWKGGCQIIKILTRRIFKNPIGYFSRLCKNVKNSLARVTGKNHQKKVLNLCGPVLWTDRRVTDNLKLVRTVSLTRNGCKLRLRSIALHGFSTIKYVSSVYSKIDDFNDGFRLGFAHKPMVVCFPRVSLVL